jgi:GMP synthase-like glutamine amidotransferase
VSAPLSVLVVEHERNAHVGLVGERLEAVGARVHVVGPEVGVALPDSVEGYDGVVVLGGTPGPIDDDRAPWLPGVRALITECLQREIPLLGVCLGAQLLAHVAGGTVRTIPSGPEIGLVPLVATPDAADDPLLRDLPAPLAAVQWHWLEIDTLPAGSPPLLASERCPHQAFRVGRVAWGVQFHLEVLSETAEAWAREDREDLRELELVAHEIVRDVRAAEPSLRATWSAVTDRWLAVVRGARSSQGEPAG